jgi:hypothetical protein
VALFGTPKWARSAASTCGLLARSPAKGLPGALYIRSVVTKASRNNDGTRKVSRRKTIGGR